MVARSGSGNRAAVANPEARTTIRISARTREVVRRIARSRGETMAQVVAAAVREEEQREMRRQMAEAAARLKRDPRAWAAYQQDLAELDVTSGDNVAEGEWQEEWKRRDAIAW